MNTSLPIRATYRLPSGARNRQQRPDTNTDIALFKKFNHIAATMAEEEIITAMGAMTIQSPPERIGSLPVELQKMVFDNLGAETYQFTYDPETSGSAFEALWIHLREKRITALDSDDAEEFQDKALTHMAEPARLLARLNFRPELDLASKLHELSLAIPCTRITSQVGVMDLLIPTAELPVAWDLKILGRLFTRLTSLQKLSLFGLWIPRGKDDRIPHELHPYYKLITIPPSVTSLYIEEGYSGDRADESAKEAMNREETEHADLTYIIEDFKGYESVTHLELKLPLIQDRCFAQLRHFTGLKTFKINQDTTALLDNETFQDMLTSLQHARELEVLELWYPKKIRANSPFHGNWHKHLPHLKTIRLSFQCFVEAFEGTTPEDNIRFELLIDTNRVPHVCLEDGEVKTLTQDRTALLVTMAGRVHNVVDRIEKVQKIFETKRNANKLERRSVGLVHYDWPEEHKDSCWFGLGEDEFDDDLEIWADR
jgi:hypothetical protein